MYYKAWIWKERYLYIVHAPHLNCMFKKEAHRPHRSPEKFCYYLPVEKGIALHLKKLKFSSPKDALCQVWWKLAQWFWRRSWKCKKFTNRRTDEQTDRRQMTGNHRKAHLSFQLRWAKKIEVTWSILNETIGSPFRDLFIVFYTCCPFSC